MRQANWQARSIALNLLALLIFASSALVSHYVPNASAQFIDRITRPCASGGGASLVQTQTLNVIINTCTGGQLLLNGVPLTPGGGSPGGLNTQVQFNDSGVFGGDAGLTYDKTTDTLTTGDVIADANGTRSLGGLTRAYTGLFLSSGGARSLHLLPTITASNRIITFPNETGTVCTTGSVCAGYAAAGSGGTVTGTGTTNKLTLWSNGAGGVLADSPITASSNDISLAGELTAPLAIRTGTASNTDVAGSLTVGAGGTITYTFTQTYTTAPVCVSSDTDAAPMITGCSANTTTLTITGTVGHVVNYHVIGLN